MLLTTGVEEEFLLVDARTGQIAGIADRVLARLADGSGAFQLEGTRHQMELATPVTHTLAELRDQLLALRRRLAKAADELGCRLVAGAGPVLPMPGPPLLTDDPRRHRQADQYGALMHTIVHCGCHVHIGTLDPDTAIKVGNHIRPWLPTLLAVSANSPFWNGHDTRHASWRAISWTIWPASGMPPVFASAAQYRQTVHRMIRTGAALDKKMAYWDLRPSSHWPTLELRAADISPSLDGTLLQAALSRALVARALRAVREERPLPRIPDEQLRMARWRAARDGFEGRGVDPMTGTLRPAASLAASLIEELAPDLEAAGDLPCVDRAMTALRRHGSGAHRQRLAFARRHDLGDVVRQLAEDTEL
ncbi:glutamate--cysteine ligase [Streptomyces sp. SAJ15]|uniref:carboxylate-amine ligase n=1 Tax=Streptomyces sp. SAJ15 TaxID=2011095 RepID=UPI001642400F|nr:glutamate--cysteine ligase [Streptomyces sp. SAJ15]